MIPRPHPRLRRAVTIVAPLALLLSLLVWGVSSPPGSSPDDDYHMASIWCGGVPEAGVCETTGDPDARLVPAEAVRASSCFAFDPNAAASCPREEGMVVSTRGNWNGESYPPLYYAVMHLFVTDHVSTSIVLMRSVNAALYVGVLTAAFFLLPRVRRPLLIWGAAVTAVPLTMFIVPSVNPSSWAILSASALWLVAWGFFEQRGWRQVLLGLLTVLLVVIGGGARSDAALYAIVGLLAAGVLAFQRSRQYLVVALVALTLAVTAFAFFLSGGQSSIVTTDGAVDNETYPFTSLAFINLKALPHLVFGNFGFWGLGWLDTYMPAMVSFTTLMVFAAVVFWGMRAGDWRKWLTLAGVAVCAIGVPLVLLLRWGVIVGAGVQPRYGFPLLIILAGVALVGVAKAGLGLGRVQLSLVAGALVIANATALHTNIRRYVTGLDDAGINLDRAVEWWWNAPISPMSLWAIGVAASVVLAASLLAVIWPTRDDNAVTDPTAESVRR